MTFATPVVIRAAEMADSPRIAALHAESWRAHYRGSLSDAYLDGPIADERLRVWNERLARPHPGQRVRLAVDGTRLIGFVCLYLDSDPIRGTLIDNLHVAADLKGRGLGRRLMQAAGQAARDALPGGPVHLYVLQANAAAQHFYDRIGGEVVEHTLHVEPDGSSNPVLRYAWTSADALVAETSA